MQSEISFLLELILNYKLPQPAKKLCHERIKEVEAALSKPTITTQSGFTVGAMAPVKSAAQLKYESETNIEPVTAAPIAVKRIVGGEVNTGNGTKGPRKF